MRTRGPPGSVFCAHTPILAVNACLRNGICFNRWSPSARLTPCCSWGTCSHIPQRHSLRKSVLVLTAGRRRLRMTQEVKQPPQASSLGLCLPWPPSPCLHLLQPPQHPRKEARSAAAAGSQLTGSVTGLDWLFPASLSPLGPLSLRLGNRGLSLKSRWRSSHFIKAIQSAQKE